MSWLREPNAEPLPGYRLIEPLGSGGFGEVWKCEAPGGLFKAIKFVYGNLHSLDVEGVRAEQELHALQRIKEVRHPFICTLEQIKEVDGELVIVMELADRSLHDLFAEQRNAGLIGIPRDDLLRYLRDAAEALDYMNEKHKLQHLDVKPRNLFLICDRVKVADFGLVKHLERQTASGLLGGVTPFYASPETFKGKISERSDQYSLAIVYYELLTGQRPFNGRNVRLLMQQHLNEEPDLRALPEAERPVVGRSLAKDPADRFPNCMAFLRALYAARPQNPVATPRAGENTPPPNGSRPKTMAETMEDMLLEAEAPVADAPDFGATPPGGKKEDGVEVSDLGITVAQPSTGALRPTLIIGLGSFGRKALLELRCRFLDRFGDLSKVPILKFLCIDVDPEAVNLAIRGAPELALTRNEVFHLPLQPVGNYRRRTMESLAEWLPREKLYAIPRSLQTQGSRALGRLAYCDNQQRLLARLKREIAHVTNPDVLYASVSQTGLALRDNTPRIYVLASATGGSSGMLADLGYALRRLLAQMRHDAGEVHGLLMAGAPNDPATPASEQANIYATLTELNHFSDPSIPFAAQYGADGQRVVDHGNPFTTLYLLPLTNRTPESLDDTISHLGSYLFHELTTPLGIRLEQVRHALDASGSAMLGAMSTPFRSFGTYAVWFPRGLLLRMAARKACERLLEGWLGDSECVAAEVQTAVAAACEQALADPELQPEVLHHHLHRTATVVGTTEQEVTPGEALARILATLEEQSQQAFAMEDPGNWALQAMGRVREWMGGGTIELALENSDWRKTKFSRALAGSAQKAALEWSQRLCATLYSLMEHPGARFAAAEAALNRVIQFCHQQEQLHRQRLEKQVPKTREAWEHAEAITEECVNGANSFRLFGGRSNRKLLRLFIDSLGQFAHQRLTDDTILACMHFFDALRGYTQERLRDLQFCRQRLRHLQQSLQGQTEEDDADGAYPCVVVETPFGTSSIPSNEVFSAGLRQSATARVVLPESEQDLERAAIRLLQRLKTEEWVQLDEDLHDRCLVPRGGLHGALMRGGDINRSLAQPLVDDAIGLLSPYMPIMDVAQILGTEFGLVAPEETKHSGSHVNLPDNASDQFVGPIRDYLDRATPLLSDGQDKNRQTLLLVPASDMGRHFGEAVQKVLPDLGVVRVPGQADLMFCREQGCLTVQDLHKLMKQFRAAYEATVCTPLISPHARFDVSDWLPLDP
jgi:eukaryotic-like serine/threonine-protein kinase